MSDFINTVDAIGDELLTAKIIDRTVTEYKDNTMKTIGRRAFYKCTSLTEIDLPNVTKVSYEAFNGCTSLTTVSLPEATVIDYGAFGGNVPITGTLCLPKVTTINGYNAFPGCNKITKVVLPVCTNIGWGTFGSCKGLKCVDLGAADAVYLAQNSFYGCSALTTFIIRSNSMSNMGNPNLFGATPISSGTGYIYVPRALIEEYKAGTNWSQHASQFRALEDYTVDGTITGELDETKI